MASTYAEQFMFGPGRLVLRPAGATPTPISIDTLQDFSMDISWTKKPLRGQRQLPLAIARGGQTIALKAKQAQINGQAIQTLALNGTTTNTQYQYQDRETSTPGATYTVTNAATFQQDMGVLYASSGIQLTRGASASAQGIYSVNESTGVYSFHASDDSTVAMKISYTYTVASQGNSVTLANQVMGTTPIFQLGYYGTFDGRQVFLQFGRVECDKLALPPKLEDYVYPELDFEVMEDGSQNVGIFSFNL